MFRSRARSLSSPFISSPLFDNVMSSAWWGRLWKSSLSQKTDQPSRARCGRMCGTGTPSESPSLPNLISQGTVFSAEHQRRRSHPGREDQKKDLKSLYALEWPLANCRPKPAYPWQRARWDSLASVDSSQSVPSAARRNWRYWEINLPFTLME